MITFTSAAAKKVSEVIKDQYLDNLNFRIYIEGGGCSGFKHQFTLDQTIAEDDTVIETDGVKLLVDPVSLEYLRDSTIDYIDGGLEGSHFKLTNPNAKSTCGCGSSFNA
jgi:iron-sulfur cluster insertion protein